MRILILLAVSVSAYAQCGLSSAPTGFSLTSGGSLGGFTFFAGASGWNQDVLAKSVNASSSTWITTLRGGGSPPLNAQYSPATWNGWGEPWYGLVYHVVDGTTQPRVQIKYTAPEAYPDSSDPGPWPVPLDARVQATFSGAPGTASETITNNVDGDKHIIVLDKRDCVLYELWNTYYYNGKIHAGTGAVFDLLAGDHQRPWGMTSSSVSGLPLLAGTIRYDEIQSGEIKHPIAITYFGAYGRAAFVDLASHHQYNNTNLSTLPPIGTIARLKSSFNISGYSTAAQVILAAMKKYGVIYVDGGRTGDMFYATDHRWNTTDMFPLSQILFTEDDFEFLETGTIYSDTVGGTWPTLGATPTISAASGSTADGITTLTFHVDDNGSRIAYVTPHVGPVVAGLTVDAGGSYTYSVSFPAQPATTEYEVMVQNANGRSTEMIALGDPPPPPVDLHQFSGALSLTGGRKTQ